MASLISFYLALMYGEIPGFNLNKCHKIFRFATNGTTPGVRLGQSSLIVPGTAPFSLQNYKTNALRTNDTYPVPLSMTTAGNLPAIASM